MSKSKLSTSLVASIGGQATKEKEDLDEALAVLDEISELESPSVVEEVNEAIERASNTEDPIPLEPVKKKEAASPGKGRSLFIGLALLLSVAAIAASGYAVLNQKVFANQVTGNFAELDATSGEIRQLMNEMTSEMSEIRVETEENTRQIAHAQDTLSRAKEYGRKLVELAKGQTEVGTRLESQDTQLKENSGLIETLTEKIKKITQKPKVAIKKWVAPKKPVTKVDQNLLEGAELASIDLWGAKPYAVLRDSSGKWIPLGRGDYYKGWVFSAATSEEEALFKKAGKSRRIRIKG